MSRKVKLRLYVTGSAPNSIAALANMKAVRAALDDDHELEIVDVLERPERALADDVLVTPTLLKLAPRPPCRIVGNLSDTHQVLSSLGIVAGAA
jgi:circadian clock protein KaiB